ncbi:hypothetical protein QQG55_18045 [Brugia pahangi]
MGVHYIWSSFSPIAMFIMYIVMFYNIRCKRQLASKIHYNQDDLVISMKRKLNMARNNIHERSMLIQAALTFKTLTFERSIRGVKRSAFQRSTCQKKGFFFLRICCIFSTS